MNSESTRACRICGGRFTPPPKGPRKMYCTPKCKDRANTLNRSADPAKLAMDNAKKAAYWNSPRGREVRALRAAKERREAAARRRAKQTELDYILDDWVWIGPYVGWSAEAAAPRIGVGYDRFLKILREAREAGDPRGVIPETVGGVRLYHAA